MVPGDDVDDAGLLGASALAPEDEAVDAGLESVLEVRECVEVEVEEALVVAVADPGGEEVAEETLLMERNRAWTSKEPERSQLVVILGEFTESLMALLV